MESLNKADMEFILPKEDKTAACNSAGICQNETTIQSLDTKTKLQGGGVWGLDFKPTKDTKNRANREGIWCCFLLFQKEIQPLDCYCDEKRKYYLYYHQGKLRNGEAASTGQGDNNTNKMYINQKSFFWHIPTIYHNVYQY